MRATDFETSLPDAPLTSLPHTLIQTPSRAAPFLLVALALPCAALIAFPFAVLVEHLMRNPSALDHQFGPAIALALAFVLWLGFFACPIAVKISRATTTRRVEIDGQSVLVIDRGLLGSLSWSEPLANYSGLTHHVRSSLSGTRHELILVHPLRSKSVLIRAAARISANEIDDTAAALGCPEIAARVIYASFRSPAGEPKSALATAA